LTGSKEKGNPCSAEKATEKLVKEYYREMGTRERKRLTRNTYHRLELDTTVHFLKRHLPTHGYILDAGGGPGRYTIELAKLGYDVALLDLTPKLLQVAREQIKKDKVDDRVKKIVEGSISDLSRFRDETFDAVVCLGGPLSHIVDKDNREKAIDELIRVAKNGAPIFVSVIGRLAVLVTELVRLPHEMELAIFPKLRDTGDYYGGYGFAPCHFYLPDEIRKSFENRGITVLEMVGLEGLASGHPIETDRLFKKHPEAWKIWWQTHLKTCTHPVSVGMSEHFLIICKK